MRTNLPITGIEYQLNPHQSIVSKTDRKGLITYVNPCFVEVSGFAIEELIGKPHNLVRHPDMPPEAFADLWSSLKAGRPWTGMVKNRRKNGDFYWVLANVTPLMEAGQVCGYMSVRTCPTRAQIDGAAALYRQFRAGDADHLTIVDGAARRAGWRGRLQALRDVSLTRRLAATFGSVAVLLGAVMLASGPTWRGAAALLALFATLLGWRSLHQAVVAPMQAAIAAAAALAGGDLAVAPPCTASGDMGQLLCGLRQVTLNLRAIIGDVRVGAAAIDVASHEIADGNADLADRTVSQAASVEQTAASMAQFAVTIGQNADSARQADQLVVQASQIAGRGGESVSQVGLTMGQISASAKRIVDIIGIIDGIAFQTNILALNAAVEAARAGEQGRGFAVVAGEVRNLAQRSASAAKEIKQLIDASVQKVGDGNRLVEEAGATMGNVVTSVHEAAVIMGAISRASVEQRLGVEEMKQAVVHLDAITQQNAALVEQSANAAVSVAAQAGALAQAVSVFKFGAGPARSGVFDADQRFCEV